MQTDNKINGQGCDGRIGDNELEPLPKVPEIRPEQAAAIAETLKAVVERLAQVVRPVVEQLVQTFKKIAEKAIKAVNEYIDNLLYCINDNPRWWHLYKNAKKWRTRKKYRNKLMRQLFRKLAAEAVT